MVVRFFVFLNQNMPYIHILLLNETHFFTAFSFTYFPICSDVAGILLLFQVVSLSSSRNIAIIGLAVILGVMIPTWVGKVENPFNTGTL